MVQCKDCGYLEFPRGATREGTCTQEIRKPEKIPDFTVNIDCKKFVPKRIGWTTQDTHDWKDRHVTMRRTFWIAVLSLVLSLIISLAGINISLYSYLSTQRFQQASLRANLSILGNVQTWASNISFTFNVSGQIRNEGSRATIIEWLEIGVSYTLKNNELFTLSKLVYPSELGWQDATILEDQSKQFMLGINVYPSPYGIDPANEKPYEGWIRIKHDDGIDIQNQVKTFPTYG